MKISTETFVLSSVFGDEAAIGIIAEAGFDAIDYSYYWMKNADEMLGDDYKDYAERLKKKLLSYGITCNQAHAPFEFTYSNRIDESDTKYLSLVRSILSAGVLGAKNIIVHRVSVPDGVDMKEYNRSFYRSLIPYCEESGINVAVENLFETGGENGRCKGVFGKPDELCDFIRSLDSECFSACVDVGHANITGTAPATYLSGMDKKLLKALHIQDNDGVRDLHLLPFQGNTDWNAVMKTLADVSYDGDFTLEIFGAQSKLPHQLLPEALKFAAATARTLVNQIG